MISERYKEAMSEVLWYLKGIKEEDVAKISKNFIRYLEENNSKEYIPNFDYNRPLNELDLMEESKGLISLITLSYWCETEEEKNEFLNKLTENEIAYQEELKEKINLNDDANN